jgi:hypothetical protein
LGTPKATERPRSEKFRGINKAPTPAELAESPELQMKYGLLLTPTASEAIQNLATQIANMGMLPTPISSDIHHADRVQKLKETGAKTMASRKNGSNRPNGLTDYMDFNGLLKTPTSFDGTVVSGKKNPVSGNSGSLAQEIASGYKPTMEKLGLIPTPTPTASDATTGAIIGKNDTFITTKNGTPRKVNQNGENGSVGLGRFAALKMLPTPKVGGKEGYETRAKRQGHDKAISHLEAFVEYHMLPTPTAYDNPAKNTGKRNQDGLQKRAKHQMLPTPAASNYRGASSTEALENRGRLKPKADNLADQFAQSGQSSQLNPLFVEEMMGFPFGYTLSPFLSDGVEQPSVDLPKDNWHHFPQNHPTIAKDSPITNLLNNVSLSKWRNESIKGYGNAVVPQIPLKIFQTIEQYNKTTNSIKKD